jgi:hypothetical protein
MEHISNEKFSQLAQVHQPHCISIFIPTHRAGMEVNENIDQKHLKNKIKTVREELRTYQLKDQDIDKILKPAEDLLEDSGFWNLLSEGLAIFIHPGFFEYYTLPVSFEPYTYISDHFYLKPLIPYLNDDGHFFLLTLSQNEVKVYEGFPHELRHLVIEELLPARLEEVVGFDYQQKNLQWRSGQTEYGGTIFHGHGAATEMAKKEMHKYFRAVNDGLMKYLYDKNYPLVVATVDYLFPIFKEANDYKHLFHDFIPGNPEHEKPQQLHQKAKAVLADYFNKKRIEKVKAFEAAMSINRAAYKEEEVVQVALNQRVDTLFIRKGDDLWGKFDPENQQVLFSDGKSNQNVSLTNLAAVHTILNRGTVYLQDSDQMPEPATKLNALLRY